MLKSIIIFTTLGIMVAACNSKPTEGNTKPKIATDSNTTTKSITPNATKTTTTTATTATTWKDDFKTMREAIYQKQKDVVANYFDFPITKSSTNFWILTGENTNNTNPFTKDNFTKNFDEIFEADFVTALQKIKTEELYSKGSFSTESITNKEIKFKMSATFDKGTNKLKLNYYTYGEAEFAVIYEFDVKDNKIKFSKLDLAG